MVTWKGRDGLERLASASDDGTVRLWDPEAGTQIGKPFSAQAAVEDLFAWRSRDGVVRLAAASADGAIYMWDPELQVCLGQPLATGPSGAWALSGWLTETGATRLVTATGNGSIQIWDPETTEIVDDAIAGHASPVPTLPVWRDGDGSSRLACASSTGRIQIWDLDSATTVFEFSTGDVSAVYALCPWQTDEAVTYLASAGSDAVLRIWNPESGSLLREIPTDHGAGIWALSVWQSVGRSMRIATAGIDGVIRVWDPDTGDPVSDPWPAHTAAVSALTSWRDPDGSGRLASAGDDSIVRLWDLDTTTSIGAPMTGHVGGVLGLAQWQTPDGSRRLASAGSDTTVLIWDPDTGTQVHDPLAGHSKGLWALTCWQTAEGGIRLASASYDGTIRIWNPEIGKTVGAPLIGRRAPVRALSYWCTADGRARLASAAGDDVQIWDPETSQAIGTPLTGHTAVIRALATWRAADGSTRLASAGDDGTVRLWDPVQGSSLRTIEVGSVQIWGLSDAPAAADGLGRAALVDAIADQLCPPTVGTYAVDNGPTVVTIEGPWGCGKSTLMRLVEQRLHTTHGVQPAHDATVRRFTVRQAMRQLRGAAGSKSEPRLGRDVPRAERGGVVTAWFNPWAHESGAQVWAGLVQAIIDAVRPVLFPTEPKRERYWFTRNLPRIDRHATRRVLRRRIVSPLLGVALVAVVVPAAIALAELGKTLRLFGHPVTTLAVALTLPAFFTAAGAIHTAVRYVHSGAVDYLPGEIFNGPLVATMRPEDAIFGVARSEVVDPLYAARAGSLYLHQHDVSTLLADTGASGHDLIIFIDDLDRCRASTTAEVFEAINLFLSGITAQGLRAHFVIGLGPVVVAAHLDQYHGEGGALHNALHGDDASAGWAFLRKLVQLPVIVPHVSDAALERFIDLATGPSAYETQRSSLPGSGGGSAAPEATAPHRPSDRSAQNNSGRPPNPIASTRTGAQALGRTKIIPWRALEQHPMIRELLHERLGAQPNRSIREAKRMLNVWQLYERLLSKTQPLDDTTQAIDRARNLLLLAESITRWPALQRILHRRINGSSALRLLANAAKDDEQWQSVLERLDIDSIQHGRALESLRELLNKYDGAAIASLADTLL